MTSETNSKAPTHSAYQVRDSGNGKSFWTRIGVAWTHKDGNGFNIQLECVPLDGRITLRVASEKKPRASAGVSSLSAASAGTRCPALKWPAERWNCKISSPR